MLEWYLSQLWLLFKILVVVWLIVCLVRGVYRNVKIEKERRDTRKYKK